MHNLSSNDSLCIQDTGWEAYITTIFLICLIIITLFGNIFVVMAIFTYKPLRNVQNFFIISLAVADMAVALLVMPFHISNILLNHWIYGYAFCDMWLTFDILLCTASILNICVIALDRYFAIHNPLQYAAKRTIKRVLIMVVAAWVISGVISVPPLFGWRDGSLLDTKTGQCHLTDEKSYVIYSALGSFFIPLLIMTGVYVKIFLATRRRLRERREASAASKLPLFRGVKSAVSISTDPASTASTTELPFPREQSTTSTPVPASTPIRASTSTQTYLTANNNEEANKISTFFQQRQRISLSKERKAARTLGFIMGAFVICWLPFFLYYVILPFCPSCKYISSVEMFVVILGYVNSGLNPIIYTIFNNDFRKAFKYIYNKKLNCGRRRTATTIQVNGRTLL